MLICLLCLSQDDTAGYSSGDNNCEEITGSARQLRSSSLTRDRPSYASSKKFTSPMTVSPPNCASAVQPFTSSLGCGEIFTQTSSLTSQSSISPNRSRISASSSSGQVPVCPLESCPSTSQPSTSSLSGVTTVDPTLVPTCEDFSTSPYQSSLPASHCSAYTSTHHQSANYENYLSVMAALSETSSDDEELNLAIMASLESEKLVHDANVLCRANPTMN